MTKFKSVKHFKEFLKDYFKTGDYPEGKDLHSLVEDLYVRCNSNFIRKLGGHVQLLTDIQDAFMLEKDQLSSEEKKKIKKMFRINL